MTCRLSIQVCYLICLRLHIRQSPREIPCGINYPFLRALCMIETPNQLTYMSHHISKAWLCLLQDHMVWRMLTAYSTSGTVLQLITFHQLAASTRTVLLLDTSWNEGLIEGTSIHMEVVVVMMTWWQGAHLLTFELSTNYWEEKLGLKQFIFPLERNYLCLMLPW